MTSSVNGGGKRGSEDLRGGGPTSYIKRARKRGYLLTIREELKVISGNLTAADRIPLGGGKAAEREDN